MMDCGRSSDGVPDGNCTFKVVPWLLLSMVCSAIQAQRMPGMTLPPAGQQQTQDSSQPDSPESTAAPLKVTTRLTLESVTVTDAAGKPVRGLKQSDFSIKEDGKPQKIKNFEEYSAGNPSQQSAPKLPLPPNVYTNAQSTAAESGAVNIFLLDMLNTGPARQATVKEKAIAYLKNMPAGTEIAIFELKNELHVVQGFTTDREALLAAVASIQPNTVINQTIEPPIIAPLADGPTVHGDCPGCMAGPQLGDILNRRSESTLAALDALAAFGEGIKGRKNLIWFSTGLPQITAFTWVYNLLSMEQGAIDAPGNLHPPITLVDYRSSLIRAYGLLAAAQVAVYPIDPRGFGDSTAGAIGELTLGSSKGSDQKIEEIPQYKQNAFASLQEIAENTGGLAFYDRDDIDAAIGEAITSGANSYALFYEPPSSKYGKFHRVEITVDRPGLELHYRQSYTAVELSNPLAEKKGAGNVPEPESEFHTAVDRGIIPSTGLLFELRVAPSTAQAKPGDPAVAGTLNSALKGKPLVRYALVYEMPGGEVTLVEGPDGARKGSLEFDAVAYGDDGKKVNALREMVNFTLKPNEVEHFIKNPVEMPVQIDLPAGKLDLHTGVLDVASQKMGTLEIPVTATSN